MREIDHNFILEKKDVEIGIRTRYTNRDLTRVRIMCDGTTVTSSIHNMGDIISGTCINVATE